MTVAVIVQARMGSSRLPGKTLEQLDDSTVLDWVIDRVTMAESVDDVIVATTTSVEDDVIESHLAGRNTTCVRGSDHDVLDRYVKAAASTSAEYIVRVTADCPLIDPRLIDAAVRQVRTDPRPDYVSTSLDGRYPRGLDVEAFTRNALIEAASHAVDPAEREHVTLFVYRNPDRFRCAAVSALPELHRADLRLTVDEPADLAAVRAVVAGVGQSSATLATIDVIRFLDDHPEVVDINRSVQHHNVT